MVTLYTFPVPALISNNLDGVAVGGVGAGGGTLQLPLPRLPRLPRWPAPVAVAAAATRTT